MFDWVETILNTWHLITKQNNVIFHNRDDVEENGKLYDKFSFANEKNKQTNIKH